MSDYSQGGRKPAMLYASLSLIALCAIAMVVYGSYYATFFHTFVWFAAGLVALAAVMVLMTPRTAEQPLLYCVPAVLYLIFCCVGVFQWNIEWISDATIVESSYATGEVTSIKDSTESGLFVPAAFAPHAKRRIWLSNSIHVSGTTRDIFKDGYRGRLEYWIFLKIDRPVLDKLLLASPKALDGLPDPTRKTGGLFNSDRLPVLPFDWEDAFEGDTLKVSDDQFKELLGKFTLPGYTVAGVAARFHLNGKYPRKDL